MKLLKSALRFWITLASVISFVGGWIALAHSPKPVQFNSSSSNNTAFMPALEPLTPLSGFDAGGNNSQDQPLVNVQPRTFSRSNPFFTTGGS